MQSWKIAALVLVGAGASQTIALTVHGQRSLALLFLVFGIYGMLFAVRAMFRGYRFSVRQYTYLADRVIAIATFRREGLKLFSYAHVVAIGLLSIDPPPWFGTFFTAVMFNLIYTMDVNSTLDDSLEARIKEAVILDRQREAEEAVTTMAQARKLAAKKRKRGRK